MMVARKRKMILSSKSILVPQGYLTNVPFMLASNVVFFYIASKLSCFNSGRKTSLGVTAGHFNTIQTSLNFTPHIMVTVVCFTKESSSMVYDILVVTLLVVF